MEVEGGLPEYEVAAILDDKMVRSKQYFLVSWKGYDAASNTWEPVSNLENSKLLVDEYLSSRPSHSKGKRVGKKPKKMHEIK